MVRKQNDEDPLDAEERRHLDSLRRALGEPPGGATPSAADIRHRASRIVVRRRVAMPALGLAAAGVLFVAVWATLPRPDTSTLPEQTDVAAVESPKPPESDEALSSLEARIADLERQVNALQATLESQRGNAFVVDTQAEEIAAVLLAVGRFQEQTRKDPAQALVRYREVLTYYPDSRAVPDARARISALDKPSTQGRM